MSISTVDPKVRFYDRYYVILHLKYIVSVPNLCDVLLFDRLIIWC